MGCSLDISDQYSGYTFASITANGPTTCTITAAHDGDNEYEPARASATITFVEPMAQTLTVTAPSQLFVGQSAGFSITPTSGVTGVDLEVLSGPCDVGGEGYSWSVIGNSAGTCTLEAFGSGNAEWAAPPPVSFQIQIVRQTQQLGFQNLPSIIYDGVTSTFEVRNSSFLNVFPSVSGPCFGGFQSQGSIFFDITGSISEGTTNFNCVISFSNDGNEFYEPYFGQIVIPVGFLGY